MGIGSKGTGCERGIRIDEAIDADQHRIAAGQVSPPARSDSLKLRLYGPRAQ